MRSLYWSFVEACDETRSIRSVKDLLVATFRKLEIASFAILTHARPEDLRSLGVSVHTWPTAAVDFLFASIEAGSPNPLFAAVEQGAGPLYWPQHGERRDSRKRPYRLWLEELRRLVGGGEGVSQTLRSVVVGASCSLTSPGRLDADRVRLCIRIANYAYQQVLALQRPRLSDAEKLTAREHELLYHATILGERPADVASELAVKVSTVRTLRQKASIRLDAGSQEQAAWRMIETGQLFRSGRTTRPRVR